MFVESITFSEFAQYIVETWSTIQPQDVHWRPQNEVCHVCNIKYDFIGHFENLSHDAKYVLTNITLNNTKWSNKFPFLNAYNAKSPLSQKLNSFFADVPRNIKKSLVRLYDLDYRLFGYDYRWAIA